MKLLFPEPHRCTFLSDKMSLYRFLKVPILHQSIWALVLLVSYKDVLDVGWTGFQVAAKWLANNRICFHGM